MSIRTRLRRAEKRLGLDRDPDALVEWPPDLAEQLGPMTNRQLDDLMIEIRACPDGLPTEKEIEAARISEG